MNNFNYTSKYIKLLNKLSNNNKTTAALKTSILHLVRNESRNIKTDKIIDGKQQCTYCLNNWRDGQFLIKTVPVKYKKKTILRTQHFFKMVIRCTICQKSTVFNFQKNKIDKEKFVQYIEFKESHHGTSSIDINKDQILNNLENISKPILIDLKQNKAANCNLNREEDIKNINISILNKKRKKKNRSRYAGLNPSVLKKINISKNKKA
ncbi:uncharacterized protein LOC126899036 [Daktulosphaira vitifoliae]|uniref:uncharacterized protein LOC126899036 n=1 Tax=Daktulosphaira vitifoliae TaxID=58002 RepID=UPI0021AA0487|nr:uncharacterized protein LOC126899036 [Daktulosphaira vitifoliae]